MLYLQITHYVYKTRSRLNNSYCISSDNSKQTWNKARMDTFDDKNLHLLEGPVVVANGVTGITNAVIACLFLTVADYSVVFKCPPQIKI
jgi:hypothetical protein